MNFALLLLACALFALTVIKVSRMCARDSARISELQKERARLEAEIEFKKRALEKFAEIVKDLE